jgi:RecA-family ATPase
MVFIPGLDRKDSFQTGHGTRVRQMQPVVILDTVIRFSEAEDENAAAQNKKLVDDVIRLRQAGAVAVIGLHHATKKMRTEGMSLELALRGTGDIAASADAVLRMWLRRTRAGFRKEIPRCGSTHIALFKAPMLRKTI